MTTLITGATGAVGRHLVTRLLATNHPVRALTRDPSAAALPDGCAVAPGDLSDHETVRRALHDVTALHLITFAGDAYAPLQQPEELMAMAVAAGVKRVTVLMGDLEPGPVEKAVADSGLEWTRLAPTQFMSNDLEWAATARSGEPVRAGFLDTPSAVVHEADIADVAAVALTTGAYANQTLWITGPQSLTARERLQALGAELGRPQPIDELTQEQVVAEWRAAGFSDDDVAFFLQMSTDPPDAGRVPQPTVQNVTGRPGRNYTTWLNENRSAFTT